MKPETNVDADQAYLERERDWGLPHENLGSYLETQQKIMEIELLLATGETKGLGQCFNTKGFATPYVISDPFETDEGEIFQAASSALYRLRLRSLYQKMTPVQFAQWCWLEHKLFQTCTTLYDKDCTRIEGDYDLLLLDTHMGVLRSVANNPSAQVTEEQEDDFCQVVEKREEEVPEVIFSEQDWLAAEERARARLLCHLKYIML